jgi:hypothetical protein
MKNRLIMILLSVFAFTFLLSQISVPFHAMAGDSSSSPRLENENRSAYEVPPEKQEKWASVQNMLEKEDNACVEHCANDSACLTRCDEVYAARLEREYYKLMPE